MFSEIDARKIYNLLENLNPKPLGCGFTELDIRKNIWEVDAYFNYKIDLGIKFLLEEIYSIKFYITEIRYTDWVAKVERKLTPISLQNIFNTNISKHSFSKNSKQLSNKLSKKLNEF